MEGSELGKMAIKPKTIDLHVKWKVHQKVKGIDFIVTRAQKGFKHSKVCVISPDEFVIS